MNKSFEKEYKELAQNNVPDLWNRIESEISERPTPQSFGTVVRKYAGLLTAAICLIVIIPVVMLMEKGGSAKGTASVNEAATPAETAPELMGAAVAEEEMKTGAAEPMNDSEETLVKEAENKGLMKQQKAKVAREEVAEDGPAFEISVTVISVQTNEMIDMESAGSLYTAMVESDDMGAIVGGSEVSLFVPIDSNIALMEGETYIVKVKYDNSKEARLELISLLNDENK